MWIGTESGLFTLNGGKISPVNAPVKDISCLLYDQADGVLWAGTSGHGLARFAHDHWTTNSSADGLMGDDVGYLIDDDSAKIFGLAHTRG